MTPEPTPEDLRNAVREDPDLLPEEKETTFRFGKRDDYATVYTAEAGLIRRLLAHAHVHVKGLTTLDGEARRDVPLPEYDGGVIVGLRARIPVGALQVKLRPRQTASHAEIVTDRVLTDGGGIVHSDSDAETDGTRHEDVGNTIDRAHAQVSVETDKRPPHD